MDEIKINFNPEVNDLAGDIKKLVKTQDYWKQRHDNGSDLSLAVIDNLEKEIEFHKLRLRKIWEENSGE